MKTVEQTIDDAVRCALLDGGVLAVHLKRSIGQRARYERMAWLVETCRLPLPAGFGLTTFEDAEDNAA